MQRAQFPGHYKDGYGFHSGKGERVWVSLRNRPLVRSVTLHFFAKSNQM